MQYIKDNNGTTTAVVIPIEEWKAIIQKHADLALLEKPVAKKHKKASDFAGILSEEAYQAITEHIKQARDEWDRDTY